MIKPNQPPTILQDTKFRIYFPGTYSIAQLGYLRNGKPEDAPSPTPTPKVGRMKIQPNIVMFLKQKVMFEMVDHAHLLFFLLKTEKKHQQIDKNGHDTMTLIPKSTPFFSSSSTKMCFFSPCWRPSPRAIPSLKRRRRRCRWHYQNPKLSRWRRPHRQWHRL